MWTIREEDISDIAVGASILGSGGGGNSYHVELQLRELLREGGRVEVIPLASLGDDDLGCGISGMGAPTVGIEKLPRGDEMWQAARALEEHLGKKFKFLIIGEVGGGNALEPCVAAAHGGLPLVDADPMGRAFPELQMDTFMIYGVRPWPFALADAQGNAVVFGPVLDPKTAERLGRAATVAMGGTSSLALPVLTGREAKDFAIVGTLTLSRRIGASVRLAREAKDDIVEAIRRVVPAEELFFGKIVDVERRVVAGFNRGRVHMEGLGSCASSDLVVDIQNEYLLAWRDGEAICTVPDIISLLEEETGLPVGTESLAYGQRLRVVGIPAAEKLKTKTALRVIGPRAFGYDLDFRPLPGRIPEVL